MRERPVGTTRVFGFHLNQYRTRSRLTGRNPIGVTLKINVEVDLSSLQSKILEQVMAQADLVVTAGLEQRMRIIVGERALSKVCAAEINDIVVNAVHKAMVRVKKSALKEAELRIEEKLYEAIALEVENNADEIFKTAHSLVAEVTKKRKRGKSE
jgi:hypothetical protein